MPAVAPLTEEHEERFENEVQLVRERETEV